MKEPKQKTVTKNGMQFSLPMTMKKKRFITLYGNHFGAKVEEVFEELTKMK